MIITLIALCILYCISKDFRKKLAHLHKILSIHVRQYAHQKKQRNASKTMMVKNSSAKDKV